MRKFLKRSLIALALIMFVLALLALSAGVLYKGTPDWYQVKTATREQVLAAASNAENKLTATQNWAARLNADQIRANLASSTTKIATRPTDTHVITFTDVELNALFDKWSETFGWSSKYNEYLADPRIVLQKDRLIFAGRLKDLGAIASIHLQPTLDPDTGKASPRNRAPASAAVCHSPKRSSTNSGNRCSTPSPATRPPGNAAPTSTPPAPPINPQCSSPSDASPPTRIQHEAGDPILFLPLAQQNKSVPVQVTNVSIDDGTLSLTVRSLTPQERTALLTRIKTADSTLAAGQ